MISKWETGIDRFAARFPGAARSLEAGRAQGSSGGLRAALGRLPATSFPKVFSLVHVLIEVFAVMVMSIYLALQPGVYSEWLIALFPPVHRDLIRDVLRDLADALRSYIVAQLLAMAVLGCLDGASDSTCWTFRTG